MDDSFLKARDVEAMDHFMYCHSPISDEAKAVFKENCRKFNLGAEWAYNYLKQREQVTRECLEEAVEFIESARRRFGCICNASWSGFDEQEYRAY